MAPEAVVAIVGRPNVGKSTLFNRLVRHRTAIVEDTPGVTRDRLYAVAQWDGSSFTLVDTGGLGGPDAQTGTPEELVRATRQHAMTAVDEADLILFVVDGKGGLHPADPDVADLLRRSGKPVILVVNKIDHPGWLHRQAEFFALGLGEPVGVSAEHGRGTGDLLDRVAEVLTAAGKWGHTAPAALEEAEEPESPAPQEIRVSLVGRPNVGKSSMANYLLGEERVIVSPHPGTTREAVDIRWEAAGHVFRLVDTAGLRRRARVDTDIEYYGVRRTLQAVDRSDVVLLVMDAAELVTDQDKKIASYAHEKGRAMLILINKWDLAGARSPQEVTEQVRDAIPFAGYAPILFVSALTGEGLHRLPEQIAKVAANRSVRLETGRLNRLLADAQGLQQAPWHGGKQFRIYYGTQIRERPPALLLFVNDPALVQDAYQRYLENRLREVFNLEGTPLRFLYRARPRKGFVRPVDAGDGHGGSRRRVAGQTGRRQTPARTEKPVRTEKPARGRPASSNGAPARGRPASSGGAPARGRPASSNGAPARGRPASSGGAPARGRPPSSNGAPARGRPASRPGTPARGRTSPRGGAPARAGTRSGARRASKPAGRKGR